MCVCVMVLMVRRVSDVQGVGVARVLRARAAVNCEIYYTILQAHSKDL